MGKAGHTTQTHMHTFYMGCTALPSQHGRPPTYCPHPHHWHTHRLEISRLPGPSEITCSNPVLTDGGLKPREGNVQPKATEQGQADLGSALRFLPPGTRSFLHPNWFCHQEALSSTRALKAAHSPVSHGSLAGLLASET